MSFSKAVNLFMSIPRWIIIPLWFSLLSIPFGGPQAASYIFVGIFALYLTLDLLKRLKGIIKPGSLEILSVAKVTAKKADYLKLKRFSTPLLIGVLLSLPFIGGPYVTDTASLAGVYVILCLGLNIMVGYTGLLNLGFAAFYAIGAYTYALLNTALNIGFWPSLPVSMVFSAIAGILVGIPALRLRGDYLAIVTLGFGEITRIVLNNWVSLTNGPNGITQIQRPVIGGYELRGVTEFYYLVLVFVILTIFLIKRVIHSKAGRVWMSIRDDEIAASAMGINTFLYKLYSFSFGALWAGLAGQLFAAKMRFVSPESFTFMESVIIVAMVILGGQGSITGPILGAVALVALPEILREFEQYRMVILGAALVFMSIFRPQGIVGKGEKVQG